MSEVTVVAKAKARPDKIKELEAILRKTVRATHEEDGCVKYTLHRSLEDPSVMMVIERWTSKQALDEHFGTEHVKELFAAAPSLVESAPEITIMSPLAEGKKEKGLL